MKKILLVLLVFVCGPLIMSAQITSSTLSGLVKQSSGEALQGATIVAVHLPTGTTFSSTTQASGRYTISNMRTGGPYTVTFSNVGNATKKIDNIYLTLAETSVLDANLEKKDVNLSEVIVTAAGRNQVFNANRTGAVTNIGLRQIQTAPSISRSISDLARATPQSNGASVGGGNYRQNFVTVDGSDFNNQFGIGSNLPASGSPISLDALEEISINVTPYDVRQSGFIGSSLNAVTRSGTNEFSGSVYYYFRTEKQQGDKVSGVPFFRNPFDFKQYGGRIGGPIIKNKLFFFFNYETENQPKQVQTRIAATPGNPFTGTGNVARPTRAELDTISAYLASKFGYSTGAYDLYSTNIERKKLLGRIDWNISKNHRFNMRYNQVEGGEPNTPSGSRSPFTNYANTAGRTTNNALWFQNSNYFQGANFYSFAAELNSKFGRFGNTLRGTYTKQDDSRSSTSSDFPFVDILKDGTPFTSFGYEPFSKGNLRKVKSFSFVDNVTLRLNKHLLLAGIQYDHNQTTNGFQRFATSYYTFNSWSDFVNGVKPTDFGITYSTAPGFTQVFPTFKFAQYSFLLQDEFAINNRIKLIGGIRFDKPTYPDVTEIKTHPLIAALTFANGEKINTGILPKNRITSSPRIGFNWDVMGNKTLQIRGGSGIFTGRIPFVWIVSQSGDAGLLQVTQTFAGQANTPGPFSPNPAAYLPATPPTAGSVIPNTISALSPNFKFPQTFKSSLAFDKKLGKAFVLTMEAIYNKDLNTAIFRNPNLVAPTPLNITGYADNRLFYPISNTQKFINPLSSSGQASPTGTGAFNTIILDNGSKGHYFSFTTKLEKTFVKGFSGSASYTFSEAQNQFDGNGDQPLSAFQGTATVNGSNARVLGTPGFILPHRVIAGLTYRKEYLKHLGTTVSLFYEGASQGNFSYVYSSDFNRDGTNGDLIYIPKDPSEITFSSFNYGSTANPNVKTPQEQSDLFFAYIDQDKYLSKHKGEYAQRNGVDMPWRNQIDVKLLQDIFTDIGKKRNTIQFSLDIFNFANLLNSGAGKFKTINASSILVPTNNTGTTAFTPGGTTKPTFRLANLGSAPVTSTYRDNLSIASTYYMQFGLRYIFN
ncbi:MAG: carboxypeptidase regulatory-like domain-containing protein [Ferruginibacter sp.]